MKESVREEVKQLIMKKWNCKVCEKEVEGLLMDPQTCSKECLIKFLGAEFGCSLLRIKKALELNGYDIEKTKMWLV